MTSPALLVAALAAVIGPLLAYVGASRKLSGKIATSEASSLWEESADIRRDYRERLAAAETRMAATEARLAEAERRNSALSEENRALVARNAECERVITRLEQRVQRLEDENARLRERIGGLDAG